MAKAKRIKGLKCNSVAGAGIRLVLLTRFEEMCDSREAALNWSDPEGVHSMRVASRRLRSALKDFMPYLRKRGLTSVLKRMKAVADALGDVRDQDVAILALEQIESRAPAEISHALKQFLEPRKELRAQARKELKSTLVENQLKQLGSEFTSRIERASAPDKDKIDSSNQPTFMKVSSDIIQDRLKELEKLSNGLFKPFDVETLHEMRITAKRLRYALELFQQCWGHLMTTYAKRVTRIQSALGEVHDCDVWIESFSKQIGQAKKEKKDDHVAAYLWLLNHFIKLRTKHWSQALARWRHWEAGDVGDKLRRALKEKAHRGRSSLKSE